MESIGRKRTSIASSREGVMRAASWHIIGKQGLEQPLSREQSVPQLFIWFLRPLKAVVLSQG
jgi:hypothetical protein